jgi:GntR family transcriptional regulator, N-acetylglucosamine utilization regulator
MTAETQPDWSIRAPAYKQEPPSPKYYKLKELIREEYSSWDPGEPIPSEAELCQMHGVSRTTVRKALDDLTNEGLLYRIQGKGTFVSAPRVRERFVQYTAGFYEDMMARGISLRTEVLEQAVIAANRNIAGQLQVALGEAVVKIRRLRYVNNHPVVISDSFVPRYLFPGIETDDLRDSSLYGLLREKYGAKLARGTRFVTVASCTEEQGRALHLPVGSPLLVISGVMYDTAGRLIESGNAWLRGDFAEIEIEVVSR